MKVNVKAAFILFVVCNLHVIGIGTMSRMMSVMIFGNEAHIYSFSLSIHLSAWTVVEAQLAENGLQAAKLAAEVARAVHIVMLAVIAIMICTLR